MDKTEFSLETAMDLYGLTNYELFSEPLHDTKVIIGPTRNRVSYNSKDCVKYWNPLNLVEEKLVIPSSTSFLGSVYFECQVTKFTAMAFWSIPLCRSWWLGENSILCLRFEEQKHWRMLLLIWGGSGKPTPPKETPSGAGQWFMGE